MTDQMTETPAEGWERLPRSAGARGLRDAIANMAGAGTLVVNGRPDPGVMDFPIDNGMAALRAAQEARSPRPTSLGAALSAAARAETREAERAARAGSAADADRVAAAREAYAALTDDERARFDEEEAAEILGGVQDDELLDALESGDE